MSTADTNETIARKHDIPTLTNFGKFIYKKKYIIALSFVNFTYV